MKYWIQVVTGYVCQLISVQGHLALVFDIQIYAPYSLIVLLTLVWCMKICTELVCQAKVTEVLLFQSIKVKSPNEHPK